MNGYEEIENQLSGGLSLGRNWWEYSKQDYNDKIYKIIKPSEITYHYFIVTNFFEEIPIEADNKINEMRKFYEETYLDYRYLFNDVNNLNYDMANPELMNFFMITNTETHNEVVNHKILLTDQCGLYYYNLQDVFYNASTLQEYFENMFKISFPRKDISVTIDSTSTSSSSDKIYKNDNVSKVIVEMEYHKLNNDLDMYEDETIQSDIEFLEDKIRKNKDNSMESKATIKKENDKLSQAIKKIKNKKAKLVKLPSEPKFKPAFEEFMSTDEDSKNDEDDDEINYEVIDIDDKLQLTKQNLKELIGLLKERVKRMCTYINTDIHNYYHKVTNMKIKEMYDKKRNLIKFTIIYKFNSSKERVIKNVIFEKEKTTENQDNFIIKTNEEDEEESDEISIYSDNELNSSQQSYNSIFDSEEEEKDSVEISEDVSVENESENSTKASNTYSDVMNSELKEKKEELDKVKRENEELKKLFDNKEDIPGDNKSNKSNKSKQSNQSKQSEWWEDKFVKGDPLSAGNSKQESFKMNSEESKVGGDMLLGGEVKEEFLKLGDKVKYIGQDIDPNLTQGGGSIIDYQNNKYKCIFNDKIYNLSKNELKKEKKEIKLVKLSEKDFNILKHNNAL